MSIYDDGSTDGSVERVCEWQRKFDQCGIALKMSGAEDGIRHGPGYARNRAIAQSSGRFLCFLDADDVMYPSRIRQQYEVTLASFILCPIDIFIYQIYC